MSASKSAPRPRKPTPAVLVMLGLSLALNGVVARWLIQKERPIPGSLAASWQGKASEVDGDTSLVEPAAASIAPVPNPSQAFHWSQIEAADFRQYIANLRAVGCPEQTIRDLVMTELAKKYRSRAVAIWQPKVQEYWRKGAGGNQPTEAQMKGLQEISHERSAVFQELFGEPGTGQQLIDLVFQQAEGSERQLLFLPTERREAAMQALRHNGFENRAAEDLGINSSHSEELRAERGRLLAEVLSPAEMEEFQLRNSPVAGTLRSEMRYFDCTPEEFKALVAARSAGGSNDPTVGDLSNRAEATEQVRQVLGEERAREFNRVSDLLYINARDAIEAAQMPVELADQAWQIASEARKKASDLAGDQAQSAAERTQQIQAVQDTAGDQLKALLGDSVSRAVRRDLNTLLNLNRSKLKP